MKKFTTATDLGGAPIFKNDLREVFNLEIWDALESVLSPFDFNFDSEGIIVSGCIISGSGPYSMASGIVYLNGEFMRIPLQSSFSLPQYIVPDTIVNDSRTFSDSTSHIVMITKSATISSSPAGSGQSIAITTATDPDDRRWRPIISDLITLRTKVISVSSWNMNTTPLKTLSHGIATASQIKSVQANIYPDGAGISVGGGITMKVIAIDFPDVGGGTDVYPTGTKWGGVKGWNDTTIELWANPNRQFGTNSTFSGSGHRADVIITYTP